MSKQLTFSATLSVVMMAALAFGTLLMTPARNSADNGAATARGSLIQVLIQA